MDASQPLNKKTPYKRRMTHKRRDQNRAAQKVYRAKWKQRLELLERQVDALQRHHPGSDYGFGA
ncbi:hypothetical protein K458DRAFT_423242 [Lentithecium fluviatile CBS 122367]|uniref:BZIP domain-containing protein n=1 Tax=Lentithecium fluviatile CBS 122367 TaxID=1168545 RepID=A0A6G1IK85_9PLEO|nr:hypothetical protein K458DRAFT_423242 [Lentithecium fluviatile CBS 122367]